MTLNTYKDLDVWKRAVDLAVEADTLSDHLVSQRKFAMADQLARAALSVPSNIAEGNGRIHTAEYAHHVSTRAGPFSKWNRSCTSQFERSDSMSPNAPQRWNRSTESVECLPICSKLWIDDFEPAIANAAASTERGLGTGHYAVCSSSLCQLPARATSQPL